MVTQNAAPAQTRPAPPTLENPMQAEEGWKTLDAPELFSFEKPGQEIAGILTDVSSVHVQGKNVLQFVLAADARVVKLLGTYDLVQKLTRAHVGCMVRIKFRGTDPSITKNGNAMKIFHVMIKGTPTQEHGSPITDEDIPF
jgi:hypothetical protein